MSALASLALRLGLRVPQAGACAHTAAGAASGSRPMWAQRQQQRSYAASGTLDELKDELDSINEAFVEARDEIEYAKEDAETVYFNEACEDARTAVQGVLDSYDGLLGKLSDDERGRLQRSMGLKMEQLKAEMKQLDLLHAEH